ncbi:hypothetical protein BSZ35_15225 [Salinibacter sp. 10B]|uniref:diacylglycerol/lipid kinase family protein n=1 Tax=Salinibacter sp. 10B TaxID=1923971 RepID=UPI000CF417CF|nr:diacylglycerol kinase family protein [Salinibacter sp. 10B]PQJ35763.1 hypothetical protein BSZ35_15225 [Salinibacter sp. 10B]
MRTHVIVNPAAGNGRVRRLWPRLESRLREASADLSVEWTPGPGAATELVRSALRDGEERIVAVGGDGTLHEVVNGFFAADGAPLAPAACLVPIPCGTGTDFRRALSIPTGVEAVELLEKGQTEWIDLLRLHYTAPDGSRTQRYALNIASFGLSSRVVRAVARSWSALPGSLRYPVALLRALRAHRSCPVDLTLDDTPLEISGIHLVAVANGHAFGGGIQIAPKARFDDGDLDVTILRDVPVWTLLRRIYRFYSGTHLTLEGVTAARGQHFTARPQTDTPVWLEADGELLGQLPVTVEVVPEALQIQF